MFNKLNEDATIPQYQTAGSAGLDLHSSEDAVILPFGRTLVPTGLSFDCPVGCEGQVRPRSGLAAKHGITVLNSPGTIDEDYKGELKVILYNTTDNIFYIKKGDRIAQLVISHVYRNNNYVVGMVRNTDGFGSTGI